MPQMVTGRSRALQPIKDVLWALAISGMVAQELVDGLNLLPADFVLGQGGPEALKSLQERCANTADEAACAKAFEETERVAVFAGFTLGAIHPPWF